MEKDNQRVALSKYLMKEGLLRLLERKHISKISVSELCREAGINRTTFYRHYNTPREVLQEFAQDQARAFSAQTVPARDMGDVGEFTARLCVFLYERADLVRLILRNDTEMDFAAIFRTLTEGFLGTRTILYQGRAMDGDGLRLVNAFFSSGMCAIVRLWLAEGMEKTPEEIAELIACSFSGDITFA